jgi:hypothetical protein
MPEITWSNFYNNNICNQIVKGFPPVYELSYLDEIEFRVFYYGLYFDPL